MDGYLKQSTASQARLIGPFIDDTDFKSASTGLTIANTDVKLRANGTTLSNKNSGGGTHQVNGMYSLTWDATDTANVGELKYSVKVTGALQVFGSYVVLEEVVYDALFGASAIGYVADQPVNMTKILGTAVSTPATAGILDVNVKNIDNDAASASGTVTFPNATLASTTNITAGTITTATNVTTVNGLAANVITAASIATGAIDADAIAADAITDAKVAADVTIASVTGSVGSVTAGVTLTNAQGIKKNTALAGFQFPMYTTAGVLATGVTVTEERSIDGGAFAAMTNNSAEIGATGIYTINLAAADTNGDTLLYKMTATGCVTTIIGPIKTRVA